MIQKSAYNIAADLEFLEETLMIEGLARLEMGIVKEAGLFDDLGLSGVADSIKGFVADHLKGSDEVKGGYVTSVLGVMLPSILLRVHPLLGIVYLVASQFGYDLDAAVTKIFGAVKPKLDAGEEVTSKDVSEIGKNALGLSAEASWVSEMNQLIKEARGYGNESAFSDSFKSLLGGAGSRTSTLPSTPWLAGKGGIVQRIFGNLFSLPNKGKIVWLLGGFAIWIVKTILMGAGLLGIAGGVSSLLGHKKPEKKNDDANHHDDHGEEKQVPPVSSPTKSPSSSPLSIDPKDLPDHLKSKSPSGNRKMWIVPLVGNGTVGDTLRIWMLDLYPEIENSLKTNKLLSTSPAFQKTVRLLDLPENKGKKTLVIPPQFTSRKQIVDLFFPEIKAKQS